MLHSPAPGSALGVLGMSGTTHNTHNTASSSGATAMLNGGPLRARMHVLPSPGSLPHAGAISCVAMSAAGDRILTGSDDHTVRVWQWMRSHEPVILSGHLRGVSSVAMSPDGPTPSL